MLMPPIFLLPKASPDSPDAEQRWAMRLPGKHRYVLSLKQSTRVWGVRVDLLPALER
jgi:hypothetical protein